MILKKCALMDLCKQIRFYLRQLLLWQSAKIQYYSNVQEKMKHEVRSFSSPCRQLVPSHDVTAAILLFPNNETVAMLVYQTNHPGVQLFTFVTEVNALFP